MLLLTPIVVDELEIDVDAIATVPFSAVDCTDALDVDGPDTVTVFCCCTFAPVSWRRGMPVRTVRCLGIGFGDEGACASGCPESMKSLSYCCCC